MDSTINEKQRLIEAFQQVRNRTQQLCQPLLIEDYGIQAIADVSPPKWHLAHTTWFFETFLLMENLKGYKAFHPKFQHIFNSYYQGVGKPYPRENRGLLSRPSVKTIYDYRLRIDELLLDFVAKCSDEQLASLSSLIKLGLAHEEQHQELLLMDVKYNFSIDPSFPSYQLFNPVVSSQNSIEEMIFSEVPGGIIELGHQGENFCFDNELPRHIFFLKPYALANRLVTNGEYMEFMLAGGYQNPSFWLADGWDCVIKNNWQSPLYWHRIGESWYVFTLSGLKKICANEPVAHVSYYEADAYARWKNKRLPSEGEWENFVMTHKLTTRESNLFEKLNFHPTPACSCSLPQQFFGDLWEWTATPYSPYPGFKSLYGTLGEYNGKFMSNQMVLRGGCCVTPLKHIRATYRNFFQPEKRWQFSGIRLAEDR